MVDTAVGDRYVLEALDAGGYSLGGEQCGHLIFRDLATTGDGLLAGLLLARRRPPLGRPLAELAVEAMTVCRRCCATCASPARCPTSPC